MTQEQDPSWLADGWKVAQIVGGLFVGILAWVGNRTTTRLDSLEKTAVTREELKEAFDQLREEREATEVRSNEKHLENRGTLRRIEDKLDAARPGVIASELERAQRDIQELREWKHKVDPFIERRVDP